MYKMLIAVLVNIEIISIKKYFNNYYYIFKLILNYLPGNMILFSVSYRVFQEVNTQEYGRH